MFAAIGNIISIIKGIFSLLAYLKEYQKEQVKKELDAKDKARAEALEKLKNAQTEQEVWDAQDSIVNNKP